MFFKSKNEKLSDLYSEIDSLESEIDVNPHADLKWRKKKEREIEKKHLQTLKLEEELGLEPPKEIVKEKPEYVDVILSCRSEDGFSAQTIYKVKRSVVLTGEIQVSIFPEVDKMFSEKLKRLENLNVIETAD